MIVSIRQKPSAVSTRATKLCQLFQFTRSGSDTRHLAIGTPPLGVQPRKDVMRSFRQSGLVANAGMALEAAIDSLT